MGMEVGSSSPTGSAAIAPADWVSSAAPVDAVLRAQLLRLKSFVETGRPAPP